MVYAICYMYVICCMVYGVCYMFYLLYWPHDTPNNPNTPLYSRYTRYPRYPRYPGPQWDKRKTNNKHTQHNNKQKTMEGGRMPLEMALTPPRMASYLPPAHSHFGSRWISTRRGTKPQAATWTMTRPFAFSIPTSRWQFAFQASFGNLPERRKMDWRLIGQRSRRRSTSSTLFSCRRRASFHTS